MGLNEAGSDFLGNPYHQVLLFLMMSMSRVSRFSFISKIFQMSSTGCCFFIKSTALFQFNSTILYKPLQYAKKIFTITFAFLGVSVVFRFRLLFQDMATFSDILFSCKALLGFGVAESEFPNLVLADYLITDFQNVEKPKGVSQGNRKFFC